MDLLQDITKFLEETEMTPTRFGRLAIGDPRLVGDLRNGREPRRRTRERVRAFIAQQVQG